MSEHPAIDPLFKVKIRPSSVMYLLNLMDANQARDVDSLASSQEIYRALERVHDEMMAHPAVQNAKVEEEVAE